MAPRLARPCLILFIVNRETTKSALAKVVPELINLQMAFLLAESGSTRDLIITALYGWLLVYNNISVLPGWLLR